LPRVREDLPRSEGVIALAGPTAASWKKALDAKQVPLGVPTR
jgi:hypothetical protein